MLPALPRKGAFLKIRKSHMTCEVIKQCLLNKIICGKEINKHIIVWDLIHRFNLVVTNSELAARYSATARSLKHFLTKR